MRAFSLLLVPLLALPAAAEEALTSGNGTQFHFDNQAALTGPANFLHWPSICVRACDGESCEAPCEDADIYQPGSSISTENGGRQLVYSASELAGLTVQRRVFVPQSAAPNIDGYVRFLDQYQNKSNDTVEVTLRYGGQKANEGLLAAGTQKMIGAVDNDELDVNDRFVLFDDNDPNGGQPAIGVLIYGAGTSLDGFLTPTRIMAGPSADGTENATGEFYWEYRLSIAKNTSVQIMSAVVVENTREEALAELKALLRATPLIEGISSSTRYAIRNFSIIPGYENPVADAGGPYIIDEGGTVQLLAEGFDANGRVLSFAWDLDNDGNFNDARIAQTQLQFDDDGVYFASVKITEQSTGYSLSDQSTARIEVRNIDPVITTFTTSNTNINEGDIFTVSLTATDPGNDPLTYDFDWDGDGEYEDENVTLVNGSAHHTYTISGQINASVKVNDGDGGTAIRPFSLHVTNDEPVLNSVEIAENAYQSRDLGVTFYYQHQGTRHTFEVDLDQDGHYEYQSETPSFSIRLNEIKPYTLTFRICDDGPYCTPTITKTVTVQNAAPIISAIEYPDEVYEGVPATYTVIAEDVNIEQLTYYFDLNGDSVYECPSDDEATRIAFNCPADIHSPSITYTFATQGTHRIVVKAKDPEGLISAEKVASINVLNAPPTIDQITVNGQAPNQFEINQGQSITLSATAHDTVNTTLTYEWSLVTIEEVWPELPEGGESGESAAGGEGGESAAGGEGGESAAGGESGESAAGDEGGESAAGGESGEAPIEPEYIEHVTELGHTQTLTTTLKTLGENIIQCRVYDAHGAEVSQRFTINVLNVAPVLEPRVLNARSQVISSVDEGQEIFIDPNATDPGDEILYYEYDLDGDGVYDDLNGDGVYDENDRIAQLPTETDDTPWILPYSFPQDGEYDINIRVSDGITQVIGTTHISVQNVAPRVILRSNSPVPEGSQLILTAEITDARDDELTLYWTNLTNNNEELIVHVESDEDFVQTVTLYDNQSYSIRLRAVDEKGAEGFYVHPVSFTNVPPTITTEALLDATEETEYHALITATDPAGENDPLTFSLKPAQAGETLPNIAIDSASGIITFTPTHEDYLRYQESGLNFIVRVADDDGGSTEKAFSLKINFKDSDGDGMPDVWELETCNSDGICLDPNDPSDAELDFDNDGISNIDEFRNGTDPFHCDGPDMPTLIGPEDGDSIATATPVLAVSTGNLDLPFPVKITYQIMTAGGANRGELVYQSDPVEAQSIEGETIEDVNGHAVSSKAEWQVPAGILDEDVTYSWRAQAKSGTVTSDWAGEWTFTVNATNSAPTTPSLRSPSNASRVTELRPTLTATSSIDADGDEIYYKFNIYRGTGSQAVFYHQGNGTAAENLVTFTLDIDLLEDVEFSWDVFAIDDQNQKSATSERWSFVVDTSNVAPTAPSITSPKEGEIVDTLTPVFSAEGSTDSDDNLFWYVFKVYDGNDIVAESEPIEAVNGAGSFEITEPLLEDHNYTLEVYAKDSSDAESPHVNRKFFVSAVNAPPPIPQLISPEDGAQLAKEEVTLSWSAVTDPEGSDVLYRLTYCTAAGDCNDLLPQRSTSASLVEKIQEGETYTWYVEALDQSMQGAGLSEQRSFTVLSSESGGGDDGGCGQLPGQSSQSWPLWFLPILPIALRRRTHP